VYLPRDHIAMTTMNPVSLSVAPVIKEAQMPKDMLEDFLGFAEEAISVGMTDQVSGVDEIRCNPFRLVSFHST
jgi:hypothetical protein